MKATDRDNPRGASSGGPQRRPRVLIDGVSAHTGGGVTFLVEQLQALDALGRFEIEAWVTAASAARLEGLSPHTRLHMAPSLPLPLRLLWEQTVLARESRRFDVVYMPANFALFASRRPQVLTLQNPNHFGGAARRVRRRFPATQRVRFTVEAWLGRRSVKRAEVVVAISQSLRETVKEDLGVRSNLRVIASAIPALPSLPPRATSPRPYALTVATDYPHKDWDGLVETFVANPDLPPLVLVGAPRSAKRLDRLRRHVAETAGPERIEFTGAIADRNRMAELYAGAVAYVAHSHLESFGLTPHEAIGSGLNVVASDIPAHREICGDRATFYDPDQPAALAGALRRALQAPPLSTGRVRERTWADNAADLADALDAACASRSLR